MQCFVLCYYCILYFALCCDCAAVPLGYVVGGDYGFMSRCFKK